jgi:peptidoglycan/LPS O-acetylase OafA/YrhL
MIVGAVLLSSAVIGVAARAGARLRVAPGLRSPSPAALVARCLSAAAGAGTVVVGLVPEDFGSIWHRVGAVTYFAAGGLALLIFGWLWRRQTPVAWFILAAGAVSVAALAAGGVTAMRVPEPGTLERLMAYPITLGMAALGLVVAQRVRQERARQGRTARRPRTAEPAG